MVFGEETIRSRQNRTVVELVKLNDRSNREKAERFRFDGIKLTVEALNAGIGIPLLVLRESSAEAVLAEIEGKTGRDPAGIAERIIRLDDAIFAKISEEKSPEGVICVAKYIDKIQKRDIIDDVIFSKSQPERIVLLESVRDPSNLGAIIRSAAALGVDRLIISEDCADLYSAKTVRASMGTLFGQCIDRVADPVGAITALRQSGRRVFAATLAPQARALGSFAVQKSDCVVIGNEGHGLSREVISACTESVYIPMSPRAESFNAAVAASLLMWEFSKAE